MNENGKKQIPLRLSPKLYDAIAAWAEDDFRSVNGQIEYLLSECVRQRKKNGKYVSDEIDVPPELDIYSLYKVYAPKAFLLSGRVYFTCILIKND